MKRNKTLSLLCAAAITVSAFAGLSLSAFADGEDSAAAIENTVTFDFDSTSIEATDVRSMTSSVVTDTTGNGTKVLSVTGSSSSSSEGRFGLSTIDISEYTSGKAHVIVDYDAYISDAGRMTYVLTNTEPTAYGEKGLFRQGRISGSDPTTENAVAGEWIHTTVDVDFENSKVTYDVTSNGTSVLETGAVSTSTSLNELTVLAFISWSANTSYIDNIKIQTGGTFVKPEPEPVETVSPEAPSTVEGSNYDLKPLNSSATLDDEWTAALGTSAKVLNHSNANTAQSTENTAITAYKSDVNVRGKSVYAAYDVYLTPESQISLTPYGNSGNSKASTLSLTADAAGVVTVSATTASGTSAASNQLVHGTWYRVVVEVPQDGDATSTTTGLITYTVYRISQDDPSKVSEVAARLVGLSSRGLATRSLSSFGLFVTGELYIDNTVVYVAPQTELIPEYGELSTKYTDGTITVTDGTAGKIAKTAVAIVILNDNSEFKSAKIYPLTFENGVATASAMLEQGDKVLVWDTMEDLKPLAEVYVK